VAKWLRFAKQRKQREERGTQKHREEREIQEHREGRETK